LARQLYAALDAAETEALLIGRVYHALDVGLYTNSGEQILAGAETNLDTDFYLYEFESELMTRHFVDGQLFGITTLTTFLTEAGVVNEDDSPLTDADVLALLTDRVTTSRGDDSMWAWQLFDELGLAQAEPLDMTNPDPDPAVTFMDPVQIFLALYELTLGTADPAAADDAFPAEFDFPDAESEALHDWASRNVKVVVKPVAPTHWRHSSLSSVEVRTITVAVSYPAPDDDVVVLSGPLAGHDPAVFVGSLDGMAVVWVRGGEKDGKLLQRANSYLTNELGEAKVDFEPKIECVAQKAGAVATRTDSIVVDVWPSVKSVFPPHQILGLLTTRTSGPIEVSRHTGSGASGAGGQIAIEGADQALCAYEGTASATVTDSNDPGWHYTITATDLRFELNPEGAPFLYDLVAGKVTVQASGTDSIGCTVTGGSSIPAPTVGGDKYLQAFITFGYSGVNDQDVGYYAVGNVSDGEDVVVFTCPGTPEPYVLYDFYNVPWLLTSSTGGLYPVSSTGGLEGSFHTNIGSDVVDTQWSLHPAGCPSSADEVTPQGTCGGAAAIPEAVR
jgi:hypothetical protein